jgi:hypothetical protein
LSAQVGSLRQRVVAQECDDRRHELDTRAGSIRLPI